MATVALITWWSCNAFLPVVASGLAAQASAGLSRVDGTPSVTFVVTKLASANSIQVSHDIRNVMAQLEPNLPQGMHFGVGYDVAIYAQTSFNTIQKTLLEAVLFTGLILLLFLHTWRSTLIVLIAIPTSVLTTFGGPLRVLGPGFHYMKASVFPSAYTLAVTVNMREIGLTAFDNGAHELWTHDRRFVRLPGLRVRDPIA